MHTYPLKDDAYRNRLSSFGPSFPRCGVTKEKLAEAGFRYDGLEDQVHCDYCKGSLKSWKEGDCPLTEHKRHFHHCSFLKPLLSFPKHPEYSNLNDRINTFPSDRQNDTSIHPTVKEFAECGFFSHSVISPNPPISTDQPAHTDIVSCFFCGITLARWNPDDDVWMEHAKVSKELCGYLIYQKGVDCVKALRDRGLSQSNQRNHQTQSPSRQLSPRPPLIPSRTTSGDLSRDNSRSRDSPNLARELIIGESRSIGTSPIQEIHRPIAIRSEPSGLASPLSSLTIGQSSSRPISVERLDQSAAEILAPPRHPMAPRNDTPLPQNIPPDQTTSSTAFVTSQQGPPPTEPPPTQRRLTARTPPLPLTHHNSSAQNSSSTQQIVPRGHTGNVRLRYTSNPRRSPIQVSQHRISPYRVPRSPNNPRTPEPLPEATVDTPEEDLRRMYVDLLRQRECKVCLSNLATVLFLPCGHLSACPACAPHLQDCHVCRAPIASQHDIYPS